MENKEDFAKQALAIFLRKHVSDVSISCIDDIVLSYLVSILEELGSDTASEDAFDVETFTEMMEAYLPGFADISSVDVCEWMFSLANELSSSHKCSTSTSRVAHDQPNLGSSPSGRTPLTANHTAVSPPKHCNSNPGRRVKRQPRSKRNSSSSSQDTESYGSVEEKTEPVSDHQVQMLLEMFPASCSVEVMHFLSVASGDAEKAAQLILAKHDEKEEESTSAPMQVHEASAKKKSLSDLDDREMKRHILQKYSYVDTQADHKEHRPVIPKTEPKKLVRYLDSQVVNMKGVKYTEMKKPDTEEMKKTYVNLKPARQYRFH